MAVAEVDFKLGGESVAYYQTNNDATNDFFSQASSKASLGLQLDLSADLGHAFKLGYQETFLGTLGLEKNLVSSARQYAQANDLNARAMTKLYVSKKYKNSLVKLGRQELSMNISPMAFSEDWNVFKNTFDAAVLVNKDIIDTTIIAAYIANANNHNDLSSFNNLSANARALESGAYMFTVLNKSVQNLPITASYYALKDIAKANSGSVLWLDVKSEHTPVKMAFQAAQLDPSNALEKTKVFGAKASGRYNNLGFSLAYSSVDDGALSVQNLGTQGDVALYTQMVNNQDFIASDADTVVLKGAIKLPVGTLTVQYGVTKDKSMAKNDFSELDMVYKFDLLDTKMFVGYIGQKTELNSFAGEDDNNNIRIWSRYTF
jgi:hypothetical protein